MALHKKHTFAPQEQVLADLAKALAHPARIAILRELARRKTCVCGEIVEVLPLAQSSCNGLAEPSVPECLEAGEVYYMLIISM